MTRNAKVQLFERYRPLIDDWQGFAESVDAPLPTCVWTNRARVAPERFAELLREDGLVPEPLAWQPGAFRLSRGSRPGIRWWFLAGLGHSQEEVSLLPVRLLDPRPGERILDLCAAPGGKTAQIVQALENRGTVVANDALVGRVRALRANLERFGAVNVTATVYDGANYPRAAGGFDRVLVDAPCSGEGRLRKQSRNHRVSELLYQRYARQQQALLRRAFALCRSGGRIVYSTCTFAPEENELVVDTLLRELDGALRVMPVGCGSFRTEAGIVAWQGRVLDPAVRHCHRVWPHLNDTGGFFAAVLEKAQDAAAPEDSGEPVSDVPAPELERALFGRYGIEADLVLREWTVHRRTNHGLYLANRGHLCPRYPLPDAVGLLLIRPNARPPKLSTSGAMLVGAQAASNFIELTREQLGSFLARAELVLAPAQLQACTGSGYVLVRYLGFGLGVGYLDTGTRCLESLFPKRWMGGVA